jgi:hypothetical protein
LAGKGWFLKLQRLKFLPTTLMTNTKSRLARLGGNVFYHVIIISSYVAILKLLLAKQDFLFHILYLSYSGITVTQDFFTGLCKYLP